MKKRIALLILYLPTLAPTPKLNRKPAAFRAINTTVAPSTKPATTAGVESIAPVNSLANPDGFNCIPP